MRWPFLRCRARRCCSTVRLAGIGGPSEGLGEVQDLLRPHHLAGLGLELLEDHPSDLGLQHVRPDGQLADLFCGLLVKHRSPGPQSESHLSPEVYPAMSATVQSRIRSDEPVEHLSQDPITRTRRALEPTAIGDGD